MTHQIAEFMLPGWLQDSERGCSSEGAERCAKNGERNRQLKSLQAKAYPKFSFFLQYVDIVLGLS